MAALSSAARKRAAALAAYEMAQIGRATHFTAHIRTSPSEKHTVRCETMEDAFITADRLTAEHGGFGRRAMVYAVTPEGLSIHVSEAMRPAA